MIINFIHIIELVFYTITAISVLYLFFFAILSVNEKHIIYKEAKKKHKILVLFPAYKEDLVIINSIEEFIKQDYPKDKFDVLVISDQMTEETNNKLTDLSAEVLTANYKNSSKAKALQYATKSKIDIEYDIVVILDADNTVEKDFLNQINNAYYSGCKAIQAHRIAKNIDTEMALLDAVSEEINNSIYRRGHIRCGLSSALIGSGMAFDYTWFKENVFLLHSAGEDKELEVLLLRQGVYIDYLSWVLVYDEKTRKESTFYNQRRRWIAAQYHTVKRTIKELPKAIMDGNWDYTDKIFQWLIFPRIIIWGITFCFAIGLLFVNWVWAIKWWIAFIFIIYTFALAIPDFLVDKKLKNTLKRLPIIFILMIINLFRIKGADKEFIHTKKG